MTPRVRSGVPVIQVQAVSLAFGVTQALQGINLVVRSGERVAIIGPSGSGKSSLIRCINGLAKPQSGQIRIFDTDIARPNRLRQCRLRMDTIFQSFHLYSNMTAIENVMLAPMGLLGMSRRDAEAHALEHLGAMGMADFARTYPFQLSGGQQQRVALARALAKSPEILLLDEPTSALDPELVQDVIALIARATAKGMTTVAVTHEIGFARSHADRLIFMCDGAIVEEGRPVELLTCPRTQRLAEFLRH